MSTGELRAHDAHWGAQASSVLGWAAVVCGVGFVAGLLFDPHETWSGFLVGFHVLVGLAIAGPLGLAFLSLSGARWSRSLESVPRAMAKALPAAAALGVVLVFGVSSLFEWSHAEAVQSDHVLQAKESYLNLPFFVVRLVAFFALWLWLGRRVARVSAETRGDDSPAARRRRIHAAVLFLVAFAPTWSLASIDWLQSLDPHWFSSIYALLTLGGAALAGLAAMIILVAALDTDGQVTESQYGDLGALLLSLALFWGYIWYCQYMLVWYTNLPEETPWYIDRLTGDWGLLTKAACILGSAVPFTLLLFRGLRRSRRALVRIAALVLFARVIDLYVLSGPPLLGDDPTLGPWQLFAIAGPIVLFFHLAIRGMQRRRDGLSGEAASAALVATPQVAAS